MEKEFVTYEIALELKELGFDEPCIAHYTSHGYYNSVGELKWKRPTFSLCEGVTITNNSLTWQEDPNLILKQVITPTFSQAFRFFREKYNLHITISHNQYWVFEIYTTSNDTLLYGESTHKSYEEAELECLKKLIEIVKGK